MKLKLWGLERSDGDPIGPLPVRPTELRFGAEGDYQVQLNPNRKRQARIGRRAIITTGSPGAEPAKARAVLARVQVDAGLTDGEIRVDQTLREALLIDRGCEVFAFRVVGGYLHRKLLQWMFKPRRVWAYAFRSSHRDMEKVLCDVTLPALNILGLENKDQIRLESVSFDPSDGRFKVGDATPTILELSTADVERAYDEITQEACREDRRDVAGARELGQCQLSIFRNAEGERLRLPFVRLDKHTRIALANESLKDWKRMLETATTPTGENPGGDPPEIPYFAPVRLSPSLPGILQARVVFLSLNTSIGLVGSVMAGAEVNLATGVIIGGAYFLLWLPFSVYWDIRRRVS